jgi:hypothetical protein
MTNTDQAGPLPEGSDDLGRTFLVVDRGSVDAEISRLAGPDGPRPDDLFIALVGVKPVPPDALDADADHADTRKSASEMQKLATE